MDRTSRYHHQSVTPADIPLIRSFMSNAQVGADVPWNWLCDRLSFTFAVSCTMHETSEDEWASRAAIFRDERGDIASIVLTEGENRGECFFMSEPDELPEPLIREMFDFAIEHSSSATDDGRRGLYLRVDPRFPERARLAIELGFTRAGWSEPLARMAIEPFEHGVTADSASVVACGGAPDGYTLIEAPDPRLKAECHSRSFGYADDSEMRSRNEAGFHKLTTMPDYAPFLDLMLIDSNGEPAAMMGFWHDPLLRMAMLEPAGTVPDHRRRGLGSVLIDAGVARLRRLGARSLWVGSDQPFYLGSGFTVVHRWDVYEKVW
ncbi:MAG: N-acetyltransferase [Spirochaetaceae bacterium]|nr:MAG: N-acetyltransferase [Spirochaetaceae bacterium]